MYSTMLSHWNIKSLPASPGRSRVGPALYVFSLLVCNYTHSRTIRYCTVAQVVSDICIVHTWPTACGVHSMSTCRPTCVLYIHYFCVADPSSFSCFLLSIPVGDSLQQRTIPDDTSPENWQSAVGQRWCRIRTRTLEHDFWCAPGVLLYLWTSIPDTTVVLCLCSISPKTRILPSYSSFRGAPKLTPHTHLLF